MGHPRAHAVGRRDRVAGSSDGSASRSILQHADELVEDFEELGGSLVGEVLGHLWVWLGQQSSRGARRVHKVDETCEVGVLRVKLRSRPENSPFEGVD